MLLPSRDEPRQLTKPVFREIASFRSLSMLAVQSMKRIKLVLRRMPLLWNCFAEWRATQQERDYRNRREYYAKLRRYPSPLIRFPRKRLLGEINTFAIIPLRSWHKTLLPDLRALGPVVLFDYAASVPEDDTLHYDASFLERRESLNRDLLRTFEETVAHFPVDWVFAYARGEHLLASAVREIRKRYGVPTVNMCLDDKNAWGAKTIGGQVAGSRGLVTAFDLWWTSARVTVDWVNAEGGHGIYLPEGCSPDLYPADEIPYTIPVSFVGGAYGARPAMIRYLREHGVPVQVFGPGWGGNSAVALERMIETLRTSQINLGHGGVGYSSTLTNVKARDFDVPCAGGGVYLTTFNADLAQHFHIGQEILCWHSYDELLELIRYYLPRPDLCRTMARRARARCLTEHRWLHRYQQICRILGLLAEEGSDEGLQAKSRESIPKP